MNRIKIVSNTERYRSSHRKNTFLRCQQCFNIGELISSLKESLFKKKVVFIEDDGLPKVLALKASYASENIEHQIGQYAKYRSLLIRKSINSSGEINSYCKSYNSIITYFNENISISNDRRICLCYFLARLVSHMPGKRDLILKYYTYVLLLANKIEGIDLDYIKEKVQRKLIKHFAISLGHNFGSIECTTSIADVLCSKTYFDRQLYSGLIFDYSNELLYSNQLSDKEIHDKYHLTLPDYLNDVPSFFDTIASTAFSKLVLKLHALDALAHVRFKILFMREISTKIILGETRHVLGNFNFRNTVRIRVCTLLNTRRTLFHELVHKAMDRMFANASSPYFKGDENAKAAYRESMRLVLINLIKFSDIEYTIDEEKVQLNELVELCFGESSIYQFICIKGDPNLLELFQGLQNVFSAYAVERLDAEFITNALQCYIDAYNNPVYIQCVQPLLNYLHVYVIPEIEKYIDEHPSRSRLKD